jgi:hypothetical protein
MKHVIAGLALALVFFTVAPKAHAQDEASSNKSTITVAVPTGGFACGRATYPEYCYGVPALGGTFWLDVYYTAYPSPNGFIAFNNVADFGEAIITAATVTSNNLKQIVTLHVEFKGATNDGDNDTYTGTGDFTFSYVYVRSGGGRGNLSGYVQLMKSGTLTITYN